MRIAVIEDDLIYQTLVCRSVEHLGHVVTFTSDRLADFAAAVKTDPDAIFLDLNLTDANAADVVEHLIEWTRNSQTDESPVVVLMTAEEITATKFAAAEVLNVIFWNKVEETITDVIGKVTGKCRKRSSWRSSQLSELLLRRASLSPL